MNVVNLIVLNDKQAVAFYWLKTNNGFNGITNIGEALGAKPTSNPNKEHIKALFDLSIYIQELFTTEFAKAN